MLLSQAARLTAERHPLDERLRRIDAAMAEHARKVARRNALQQQWEAARAQAILDVDDQPPLPDELIVGGFPGRACGIAKQRSASAGPTP